MTAIKKHESSDFALAGSPILTKPVKEMSLPERAQAHAVLKFLEGSIKSRLEQLREPLLSDAENKGTKDAKNEKSYVLFTDGIKVKKQHSKKNEPTMQKMFDLLAFKKLEIIAAYDEQKHYVYNPSKVEILVQRGQLTKEEVEKCCQETYSLIVEASPELEELLLEAAKAYGADPGKKGKKKAIGSSSSV